MEYVNRNPKIFVLSGKAKSGKNTVANIINEYYKDKCIQISFAHYLKEYVKNISNWDGSEDDKPRDLLQSIGIDLIKNKINPNLLIDRICDDIKVYSYFFDYIIITDARLVDEVEMLKNNFECVTIRITNLKENNLTIDQQNHITETDLDNYKFDYVIENNEYLKDNILKVIK